MTGAPEITKLTKVSIPYGNGIAEIFYDTPDEETAARIATMQNDPVLTREGKINISTLNKLERENGLKRQDSYDEKGKIIPAFTEYNISAHDGETVIGCAHYNKGKFYNLFNMACIYNIDAHNNVSDAYYFNTETQSPESLDDLKKKIFEARYKFYQNKAQGFSQTTVSISLAQLQAEQHLTEKLKF